MTIIITKYVHEITCKFKNNHCLNICFKSPGNNYQCSASSTFPVVMCRYRSRRDGSLQPFSFGSYWFLSLYLHRIVSIPGVCLLRSFVKPKIKIKKKNISLLSTIFLFLTIHFVLLWIASSLLWTLDLHI